MQTPNSSYTYEQLTDETGAGELRLHLDARQAMALSPVALDLVGDLDSGNL